MKKIVKNFLPTGGRHCTTHALKQLFSFYGHPLCEEMLFGAASGLSFATLALADGPLISGRVKPLALEQKLAQRLHVRLSCRQPKTDAAAFSQLVALLDRGTPVMLYVDMAYLRYLGLPPSSHFGGHAVVAFGYDDGRQLFYVSDRDGAAQAVPTPAGAIAGDFHCLDFAEMALARGSRHRPFPANRKALTLDCDGFQPVTPALVRGAILDTCESMLRPPAQMLGVAGIAKFSRQLRRWERFPPEKRKRAGMANYFQISADGGTGGGLFRSLYGGFLQEAAPLLPQCGLREMGARYLRLGQGWDALAASLRQLGQTGDAGLLPAMSDHAAALGQAEGALLEELQRRVS